MFSVRHAPPKLASNYFYNLQNAFFRLGIGCDIYFALAVDLLHVLKSGIFGTHLVPLTMEALEELCGGGALSTLDERYVFAIV